jgi:DNA topoisomerase VI subunit B
MLRMHHAYYIEGPQALFETYKEHLKPFVAEQFERFGIDEARELIAQAQLKNFGEATFFIGAAAFPIEAQQALLKLFEEPQPGTIFVLLVPHGTIIPTLRSRMLPYPTTQQQNAGQNGLASPARHGVAAQDEENRGPFGKRLAVEFLKSNQKDRSTYITKLLKDDDVREPVRDLLNGLEAELYKQLQKKKGDKELLDGLADIAKVRSYVGDRSPSFKMLLEHLAIALPTL